MASNLCDKPDLTPEEREELERAANDEDGDEVVDGAAFLNKIGIPWREPEPRYLFLRKIAELLRDDTAQTLRRLWPMLPRVSVVEYKSPSRLYRKGNLDRLWSYVHTYYADQHERSRERADGTRLTPGMEGAPDVWMRADLCAVLVVPARTPSLLADAEEQGLAWVDRGDGYWEVTGGKFALYVLEIDVVGPAEGDDLLHSLGHGKPLTAEARSFWIEFVGSKEAGMSMQDMEGYDELMTRLLDALPPAQVMTIRRTLTRVYRSSRHSPRRTSAARSLLVENTNRPINGRVSLSPTRR